MEREKRTRKLLNKMDYLSYNGEKYTNHPDSAYDHHGTSLGDIDNEIVAVGSFGGNTNVEIFDINSNTWTTKTSYPFCSE